ncbi:glycosyltransferase family 4 protein [Candidatus Hydrogenedentota bacterium]
MTLYLVVFLCATAGTWLVRRLARRHNVMDIPGERSSHEQPTPRGGGVAIVVAVAVGLGFRIATGAEFPLGDAVWIFAGAFALALVGLGDDLLNLPVAPRLVVQFVVAILLACMGIRLDTLWLPFVGNVTTGLIAWPLTVLTMVTITNFFNFMDGIDGLAGGEAVLVGIFLATAAAITGQSELFAPCLAVAFAALGFLVFNFPPASIFMGDSGSLFLGFFFAAATVKMSQHAPSSLPLCFGLLLLGTFVFDAAFTICRRAKNREPLHKPHRSHLYQRLIILGLPHLHATLGEYALTLALGGSVLLGMYMGHTGRSLICLIWLFILVSIAFAVRLLEKSGWQWTEGNE